MGRVGCQFGRVQGVGKIVLFQDGSAHGVTTPEDIGLRPVSLREQSVEKACAFGFLGVGHEADADS